MNIYHYLPAMMVLLVSAALQTWITQFQVFNRYSMLTLRHDIPGDVRLENMHNAWILKKLNKHLALCMVLLILLLKVLLHESSNSPNAIIALSLLPAALALTFTDWSTRYLPDSLVHSLAFIVFAVSFLFLEELPLPTVVFLIYAGLPFISLVAGTLICWSFPTNRKRNLRVRDLIAPNDFALALIGGVFVASFYSVYVVWYLPVAILVAALLSLAEPERKGSTATFPLGAGLALTMLFYAFGLTAYLPNP